MQVDFEPSSQLRLEVRSRKFSLKNMFHRSESCSITNGYFRNSQSLHNPLCCWFRALESKPRLPLSHSDLNIGDDIHKTPWEMFKYWIISCFVKKLLLNACFMPVLRHAPSKSLPFRSVEGRNRFFWIAKQEILISQLPEFSRVDCETKIAKQALFRSQCGHDLARRCTL